MSIVGTPGNDVLTGTIGDDTFFLTKGGDDVASGLDGDDIFNMGGALTAADRIRGGPGHDIAVLAGDYSDGLVLGAQTLTSIARVVLKAGSSYDLTMDDGNVAAGASMKISARALGAGESFTFDGRAETDGAFRLVGGAGDDVFTLGSSTVGSASKVSGGAGQDTVILDGDWPIGGFPNIPLKITGVETVQVTAGHSYGFLLADAAVGKGETLTLDASALAPGDAFGVNALAETDGLLHVIGGGGSTVVAVATPAVLAGLTFDGGPESDALLLSGAGFGATTFSASIQSLDALALTGAAFDITTVDANVAAGATLQVTLVTGALTFDGGAETDGHFLFTVANNIDHLTGGARGDTYAPVQVDAYGSFDTFDGFDFANDVVEYHPVDSVSTASHVVTAANLAADIDAACSAVKSSESWAELIQVAPGSDAAYAGGYFLVVANPLGSHTSGYQAGDLLLFLPDVHHAGQLDVSDFIA